VNPDPAPWMALAVLGPVVAGLVALWGTARAIRLGLVAGATAAVLGSAALFAQVTALGPVRHALGGWEAPLGIALRADGLAAQMLAMTALVGVVVSLYATSYFGDVAKRRVRESLAGRGARYFAPLWLILWGALNGIYLSGDLFNLYVLLEIVSLAAAAMVTLAVTSKATVAGMRYLLISLIGSMCFLLGVALLYIAAGTLSLAGLAEHDLSGPLPAAALGLMTVGLAAKTALFPLHAWLPAAHASAPAPGSAILSALVVKGSFVVVLRLWVDVYDGGTRAGVLLLGTLGAVAVLWGSIMALRQLSLKRLIAYSTVAQLGYLFVLFPLLFPAEGGRSADAWAGGLYHAVSHGVAKAAMFLAAGTMTYALARDDIRGVAGVAQRLPMTFFAFGLAGLSLAGIPPTGGFLAKWLLLRAAVDQGAWVWAAVIVVGGLLTLAYVLLVLRYAVGQTAPTRVSRRVPRRMQWTAMALAVAALILGLRGTELLAVLEAGPAVAEAAVSLTAGGAPP